MVSKTTKQYVDINISEIDLNNPFIRKTIIEQLEVLWEKLETKNREQTLKEQFKEKLLLTTTYYFEKTYQEFAKLCSYNEKSHHWQISADDKTNIWQNLMYRKYPKVIKVWIEQLEIERLEQQLSK